MAEPWVRLWAGMTTDPKWQTISRKSGQPRHLVIAIFTHLMILANEAKPRGCVSGMVVEDIASALDCDENQIDAVVDHCAAITLGRVKRGELSLLPSRI